VKSEKRKAENEDGCHLGNLGMSLGWLWNAMILFRENYRRKAKRPASVIDKAPIMIFEWIVEADP
jgi:hypothetical protein